MSGSVARAAASPEEDVAAELDGLEQRFELLTIAFRQRVKQDAAALHPGLPPAAYRVVTTLARSGPVNQSVLAEALGFEKSVLSRQLHQLADLGLVTRAPDPRDRRAAVIAVTPEALERLAALRSAARDSFRRRMAAWDRSDLRDLDRLLARLQAEYRG